MQSYTEADAVLTGRCKARRKVANNTWLERRGDGSIAVRLHDTDVVVYHPDGSITLDTGDWFTVTTKARMCEYTPFSISSTRGEWFVAQRNPNYDSRWDWEAGPNPEPYWHDPVPFRNGMQWRGDHWEGVPAPDVIAAERAERNAQRKAIAAFVKGITPERIIHAWNNTGGDCLLCRFEWAREAGMSGSDDHLAMHVEEDYFHASLMYLAIKAKGYPFPDVIMQAIYSSAQYGRVDRILTNDLRKYLNRHLLEGVATR